MTVFALRGHALRGFTLLHSREAALMTRSVGRAPRSAVMSSAVSRSCTPERLRS